LIGSNEKSRVDGKEKINLVIIWMVVILSR